MSDVRQPGDATIREILSSTMFKNQAISTSVFTVGFNILGEWLALSSMGKRPNDALDEIGLWHLMRLGKANNPTAIWSNILITLSLIAFFVTAGQYVVTEAVEEGKLPRLDPTVFHRGLLRFVPVHFTRHPNYARALVMMVWWPIAFGLVLFPLITLYWAASGAHAIVAVDGWTYIGVKGFFAFIVGLSVLALAYLQAAAVGPPASRILGAEEAAARQAERDREGFRLFLWLQVIFAISVIVAAVWTIIFSWGAVGSLTTGGMMGMGIMLVLLGSRGMTLSRMNVEDLRHGSTGLLYLALQVFFTIAITISSICVLIYREQGNVLIVRDWNKIKQQALPFTSNSDFQVQVTHYLTVLGALGLTTAWHAWLCWLIFVDRLGDEQDKVLLMQAYNAGLFSTSLACAVTVFETGIVSAFASPRGAASLGGCACVCMLLFAVSVGGLFVVSVRHKHQLLWYSKALNWLWLPAIVMGILCLVDAKGAAEYSAVHWDIIQQVIPPQFADRGLKEFHVEAAANFRAMACMAFCSAILAIYQKGCVKRVLEWQDSFVVRNLDSGAVMHPREPSSFFGRASAGGDGDNARISMPYTAGGQGQQQQPRNPMSATAGDALLAVQPDKVHVDVGAPSEKGETSTQTSVRRHDQHSLQAGGDGESSGALLTGDEILGRGTPLPSAEMMSVSAGLQECLWFVPEMLSPSYIYRKTRGAMRASRAVYIVVVGLVVALAVGAVVTTAVLTGWFAVQAHCALLPGTSNVLTLQRTFAFPVTNYSTPAGRATGGFPGLRLNAINVLHSYNFGYVNLFLDNTTEAQKAGNITVDVAFRSFDALDEAALNAKLENLLVKMVRLIVQPVSPFNPDGKITEYDFQDLNITLAPDGTPRTAFGHDMSCTAAAINITMPVFIPVSPEATNAVMQGLGNHITYALSECAQYQGGLPENPEGAYCAIAGVNVQTRRANAQLTSLLGEGEQISSAGDLSGLLDLFYPFGDIHLKSDSGMVLATQMYGFGKLNAEASNFIAVVQFFGSAVKYVHLAAALRVDHASCARFSHPAAPVRCFMPFACSPLAQRQLLRLQPRPDVGCQCRHGHAGHICSRLKRVAHAGGDQRCH